MITLKKILLASVILSLFFGSANANAEEEYKVYTNVQWNFQIDIPKSWNITEADEIIKAMESRQDISPQALEAIKNSGVLVNISQFPFASTIDFNPNFNISAKNIEVEPKPIDDKDILDFAKKILSSIFKGEKCSFNKVNFNNFIGINSSYKAMLKDNLEVISEIVILIDRDKNNYFIITFAYKDAQYLDIFKKSIESFRKLQNLSM